MDRLREPRSQNRSPTPRGRSALLPRSALSKKQLVLVLTGQQDPRVGGRGPGAALGSRDAEATDARRLRADFPVLSGWEVPGDYRECRPVSLGGAHREGAAAQG